MAKDYTALKIIGLLAGTFSLFALKKKADYTKVIEQMTIDVRDIRKLHMSKGKGYLEMDLGLHNPTDIDFDITTAGLIKIKQIKLFHKGKELGNAYSDLTKISLPAKSNFLIQNIQVELLLLDLAIYFLNGQLDLNMNNYQVHVYLEALGKTWIVEQ
jgi:hypothetical protein